MFLNQDCRVCLVTDELYLHVFCKPDNFGFFRILLADFRLIVFIP